MSDFLTALVERKRTEVAQRCTDTLPARYRPLRPGWFASTLANPRPGGGPRVIAEVKERSPSKGVLRAGLDHRAWARAYRAGVVVDAWQIADAHARGADAILLMVRVVGAELPAFIAACAAAHLDAVVETHDAGEIDAALAAGARVVGVNARDFATFGEDAETAARLLARIPDGCVRVAESALRTPADVARAHAAGAHAVLIGEALMRADDPAAALRVLAGREEDA